MTKQEIVDRFTAEFGPAIEVIESSQPEPFIFVAKDSYHEFCEFARNDPDLDFDFLFQLAGVHYPGERFEVVLHLTSHAKIHGAVIKVKLDHENPELATVSDIWSTAAWHEREAMELFGITFLKHPDPRPLLLYDDWDFGYPMRKGWSGPDFIPMPEK